MNFKLSIKKILALLFFLLIALFSLFIFINRDKIVTVGIVKIIDIDCSEISNILDLVYESDQRVRQPGIPLKERALEDHRNQELVISVIEKCGIPNLGEVKKVN